MKLSRANLEVRRVASSDDKDAELSQVHIEQDGSTAASNGKSLLAVQPVSEERVGAALPTMEDECTVPSGGVGVRLGVIDDTIRNLPKGNLGLELGYAVITECDEEKRSIELTTTDLNKRRKVEGQIVRARFPEYRHILRRAKRAATKRVCVDRKELMNLLAAMDKACPHPDNAVFIEFGGEKDGLVLRSVSVQTGQRAVGYTMPLDTGGDWLVENEWEKKLFAKSAKRKINPAR